MLVFWGSGCKGDPVIWIEGVVCCPDWKTIWSKFVILRFTSNIKCICWIKRKQGEVSCCRSPLWQLCQDSTGGTWTGCQSKLEPGMTGMPRPGCRSSAGGGAQCQPLQKEANVSVRGYYCCFWLIYRTIRRIISQSVHRRLQTEECKTETDRVHDPFTKEL